jgi:hypothetical protein
MKKFDPEVPVYNAKFKDTIEKIRLLLKEFQHELVVIQKEEGGSTASVEVRILLKK